MLEYRDIVDTAGELKDMLPTCAVYNKFSSASYYVLGSFNRLVKRMIQALGPVVEEKQLKPGTLIFHRSTYLFISDFGTTTTTEGVYCCAVNVHSKVISLDVSEVSVASNNFMDLAIKYLNILKIISRESDESRESIATYCNLVADLKKLQYINPFGV